jgi:ribonuclease PH
MVRASLFDGELLMDHVNPDNRQLHFKRPSGRSREALRSIQIAWEIVESLRGSGKVEAAVVEVAEKHRVSPRTVWNAWERHKDSRWVRVRAAINSKG